MQVKDTEGKVVEITQREFDSVEDTVISNDDECTTKTMLGLDKFMLLNLLGLDIEIEFSEHKKEVIKNVHFRSVEKAIESSSDHLKKAITFEAKDIIKNGGNK